MAKKPTKRLKSTSKGGQSLKSRAAESKGSRKKELTKLSKVDKANYKKAPPRVQAEIKESYAKGKKKKDQDQKRWKIYLMPKVGGKHFSYTDKGQKAAKKYAKKTGQKVKSKKGK